MKLSIIGSGAIGSSIATILTRAGIAVSIANSRGPASLQSLVAELGPLVTPASVEEAARADLVFLAVNWSKIPAAVAGLPAWDGRIVIDANNPIESPAFRKFDLGGKASSEVVAGLLPGARVVKAFNHLPPALLRANPAEAGGRRVLFLAGDHIAAKNVVSSLISRLGFAPIDLGDLAVHSRQSEFPGGALTARNLVLHA